MPGIGASVKLKERYHLSPEDIRQLSRFQTALLLSEKLIDKTRGEVSQQSIHVLSVNSPAGNDSDHCDYYKSIELQDVLVANRRHLCLFSNTEEYGRSRINCYCKAAGTNQYDQVGKSSYRITLGDGSVVNIRFLTSLSD